MRKRYIIAALLALCLMSGGCSRSVEKKVMRNDRNDRQTEEEMPYIFSHATADKETFTDAAEELLDTSLTDPDFTENRGVSSSMYHCVVNRDGVTYIYLEFPNDGAADDYWNTFTTYFDETYLIETEGDYGYIVSTDDRSCSTSAIRLRRISPEE